MGQGLVLGPIRLGPGFKVLDFFGVSVRGLSREFRVSHILVSAALFRAPFRWFDRLTSGKTLSKEAYKVLNDL